MRRIVEMVDEFCERMLDSRAGSYPNEGGWIDVPPWRRKKVTEEYAETVAARTAEEVVDGHLDLVYVLLVNLRLMGVDVEGALEGLCESNLTKTPARNTEVGEMDAVRGSDHREFRAADYIVGEAVSESVRGWPPGRDARRADSDSLAEAARIMAEKGADYNTGSVRVEDYFPDGLSSYAQMLHVKATRVRAVASSGRSPAEAADSLIDLIVYAALARDRVDQMARDWGREEASS